MSAIRPLRKPKGGRPPKYPFAHLDVGQSFFVENKTRQDLSGALAHSARKRGHEYTTMIDRIEVDGEPVDGVRVWRVK